MKFTALDIESNQPSGKIIQVGAALFDTDAGLVSTYVDYIDPGEVVNWDHVLNTGATLEKLLAPGFRAGWEHARSPNLRGFWEWHSGQQAGKKFIQWGRGDMAQVLVESQGLGYPSHLRVLDLKQVYQFLWQPAARLQRQSGLSTACARMRVAPPKPAHDALSDAVATGWLMAEMCRQVRGVSDLLEL